MRGKIVEGEVSYVDVRRGVLWDGSWRWYREEELKRVVKKGVVKWGLGNVEGLEEVLDKEELEWGMREMERWIV